MSQPKKTAVVTTPTGFQVSVGRFTPQTFPPYLSSPFWPTAPYIGAPKFVVVPQGLRPVPEYDWGCPEDMPDPDCGCNANADGLGAFWGSPEKKKERARKKAAKLRAKAGKIEKEAGIVKKAKKSAGFQKGLNRIVKKTADLKAVAEAPEEPETPAPEVPEGVPQNAEEGSNNMKLIIGGTLALMAAIGVGFAMQQSKKKAAASSAPESKPAPAVTASSPAPAPAPAPAPMAVADESAADIAEIPVSANPRGTLLLLAVRPR